MDGWRSNLHCTSVYTVSFSDSSWFNKVVGEGGIPGEGARGEVGETTNSGVDGEVGRVKEEGVGGIANSGWLPWSMDVFARSFEDSLPVSNVAPLAVPFALLAEGEVAE